MKKDTIFVVCCLAWGCCFTYIFINEDVNFMGIYFVDYKDVFFWGGLICWLILVYDEYFKKKKK